MSKSYTIGWGIKGTANSVVGSYSHCNVPGMAELVVDGEIHSLSKEPLKGWLLKKGMTQGVVDAFYGMSGPV